MESNDKVGKISAILVVYNLSHNFYTFLTLRRKNTAKRERNASLNYDGAG